MAAEKLLPAEIARETPEFAEKTNLHAPDEVLRVLMLFSAISAVKSFFRQGRATFASAHKNGQRSRVHHPCYNSKDA